MFVNILVELQLLVVIFWPFTVDGQVKCEKWIRDDDNSSEQSKATWWLNRLMGRTKRVTVDWPFPFSEDKLFVLTLSAGLEGYHVNVDGRHVTSFPYRIVSNTPHLFIPYEASNQVVVKVLLLFH